jgi:hypothetical protein
MSLHDEYARLTPFEIAFPEGEAVDRLVEEIDHEAASRGVDPSLPDVFLTLGSVDDFVRRLQPPDASSVAMSQYGALVFHATHFVRAGRPVYLLTTGTARLLVGEAPAAEPSPPSPAGYLQLPQHLVWMESADDEPPESVDGIFWVASEHGALHALPVTGVLPDGPGFRALPLQEAPLSDARVWVESEMRGRGEDFSSTLPGRQLDGLYAVQTAGEVLKLLARFFALMTAASASGEERTASPAGTGPGPRPSELPYIRV